MYIFKDAFFKHWLFRKPRLIPKALATVKLREKQVFWPQSPPALLS